MNQKEILQCCLKVDFLPSFNKVLYWSGCSVKSHPSIKQLFRWGLHRCFITDQNNPVLWIYVIQLVYHFQKWINLVRNNPFLGGSTFTNRSLTPVTVRVVPGSIYFNLSFFINERSSELLILFSVLVFKFFTVILLWIRFLKCLRQCYVSTGLAPIITITK